MKSNVTIKSFANGVSVHLAEDVSLDIIKEEIAFKFKETEKFFKNAKIAITFEGRVLTDEQERELITAITRSCEIQIVCIVGKDDTTNQTFLKAINQLKYENNENTGQLYRGTLKDGQVIETERNIIILGDVNPGCKIISKKNIIILGGLYGEAHAGFDGNPHIIVALNMAPEKMRIADYRARITEKQNKWPIKPKHVPKMAFIKDHKLVIEEVKFTEELLSELFD